MLRQCREKRKSMTEYERLREEYPCFYYRSFEVAETGKELAVTYRFEIPGLSVFEPTWRFPKKSMGMPGSQAEAGGGAASGGRLWKEDAVVQRMIFLLGMVEAVSYWKLCCPPRMVVEAGSLGEWQREWWKEQYFYGLGEFFYTNGIPLDREGFLEIESAGPEYAGEVQNVENPSSQGFGGFLIPIGGGKDSAVTLELLSAWKEGNYCYMINGRGATMATAKAGGYGPEKIILAKRTLDKRMLELNRQGFLNGHTPFSAIVAFSSILAAKLCGLRYVALSNESSANESTVAGSSVNHQYSKSFKFEEDFRRYEAEAIGSGVSYFSLLRPWSEYQIAGYFAGLPQYHQIFRSCNVGSKQDIWCGHCPKCLFVYLILSPFLEPKKLEAIFGKNLLADQALIPVLDKLIGVTEEKPFECVGSRDEVSRAAYEAIQRFYAGEQGLPPLLAHFTGTGQYTACQDTENPYLTYFEEENAVPEPLKEHLRGAGR